MFIHSAHLRELGWSSFFDDHFRPCAADGLTPARVAAQHRGAYALYAEAGDLWAQLAGKLRGDYVHRADGKLAFEARVAGRLPAVGDWVAASVRASEARATIHAVLPRRTQFSRKAASTRTEQQVLAANVDTVFIVNSVAAEAGVHVEAQHDRLEKRARSREQAAYLAMARESGARPVILVTKADLRPDAREWARTFEDLGVDVLVTSALTGDGLDGLEPYLSRGQTVALVGSSGVGKSTLINALLGRELLLTREVDRGGGGRHATVRRELVRLPGGGLVIDTPGLRELHVWYAEEGIDAGFADIEDLGRRCRFRDCRHDVEPGCAVRGAIESGALERSRLANLRRLERELAYLEFKALRSERVAELRRRYRALSRAARRRRAR